MKTLIILLASTLFIPILLSAQNSFTVSGKVLSQTGKPEPGANAIILDKENKLVKSGFSHENGNYSIEAVPAGEYQLRIMLSGFETVSQPLTVNGPTTVPDINLQPLNSSLHEVSVRSQKPFIEVKADMLVVNVENSIVSAGSSVMDVLQKSPGVNVDNNDNISLKGKQGVNVMIDGRIVPISGQDLANLLKGMPSSSIEKIELISNPGARYDAAGTGGIINIKTKKDKRFGINGSVNASYAQGVYPKYGAGTNLNYRNKKLNVNLNYNYALSYWFNHLMLDRRFYDTAAANKDVQQFAYVQDNYAIFDFRNHNASLSADYSISAKTTIGIAATGGQNAFDPKADNSSRALGTHDELLYYFYTRGRHNQEWNNYTLNGNLRHSFDSNGRSLSVDVDYLHFWNQSNQHFITTYTSPDSTEYQPPYYLSSDLSGVTQIRSVKADYSHPLKNNGRLDAGIKASYVTADNEPLFYEKENGEFVLDPKRSNHFVYNENINAAYLNFSKDWNKWSSQLGLRAEQTNADWHQLTTHMDYDTSYTQLFPSIATQYHLTPKHDIGLSLTRRIERPNYRQLNPFKFYIDRTTYQEGYPYLRPATVYFVELSHTYNQRLITTLTYAINRGSITQVIQPSDTEDSITVQTDKNLDQLNFYGISGSYMFNFTKWWSNTTNFNAYLAIYEGNIANTPLRNGYPTFDINTNNSFVLPYDMSAELGCWYQAQQIYGYMELRPTWMLNAGLQKNFFNKQFTVRLNAQDIFWKGYPSATSRYTGYVEKFVAERDTRKFTVALTYRFGKKTVAPVRRRESGAEEEKRRAASGGA